MKYIYRKDQVELDPSRISSGTHDIFGETTIFHDAVIASEMVQEYEDGIAFKSRDELELYVQTMEFSNAVVIGAHPVYGIVSVRDEIAGRTINHRFVKNLIDPTTERPNRAGVRADVEIFNKKIAPEVLSDMKNGKKGEVSVGFFHTIDETPGEFNGIAYDYVQRNMLHNHLAAGIDNARCPDPFCGLGADEIKGRIAGDPFAGFSDFADCQRKIKKSNPELSDERVDKICGALKAKYEDEMKEDKALRNSLRALAQALVEEMEEIQGMKDALKEEKTEGWWRNIDWKDEEYVTIFDSLSEDMRSQITEAGLCPTCEDAGPRSEAERAMAHFDLTEEEWDKLSSEEKQEYIDKLPPRGSAEEGDEAFGGYKNFEDCVKLVMEDNPSWSEEQARTECTKIRKQTKARSKKDTTLSEINSKIKELQDRRKALRDEVDEIYAKQPKSPATKLWDEISKIDEELQVFLQAKAIKIADTDEVTDVDGYELDYVETDVVWSYAYKKALPDSAYAYIEPDCEKKDGKTQQSCRHIPIKDKNGEYDEAHVRAALSALGGGRTGKVPPYASKAKPKVCAGAKALKMESEVCGTKKKKEDTVKKLDAYEVLAKAGAVLRNAEDK